MSDTVEVLPRPPRGAMSTLAADCTEIRELARQIWWRAQREPLSDEDRKNLEMAAFDAEHTLQANPKTEEKREAA